MKSGHTDWTKTRLHHVTPVDSRSVEAVALATQLRDDGQGWEPMLLLLSGHGEVRGHGDWLPIAQAGNAACVTPAGESTALVAIADEAV